MNSGLRASTDAITRAAGEQTRQALRPKDFGDRLADEALKLVNGAKDTLDGAAGRIDRALGTTQLAQAAEKGAEPQRPEIGQWLTSANADPSALRGLRRMTVTAENREFYAKGPDGLYRDTRLSPTNSAPVAPSAPATKSAPAEPQSGPQDPNGPLGLIGAGMRWGADAIDGGLNALTGGTSAREMERNRHMAALERTVKRIEEEAASGAKLTPARMAENARVIGELEALRRQSAPDAPAAEVLSTVRRPGAVTREELAPPSAPAKTDTVPLAARPEPIAAWPVPLYRPEAQRPPASPAAPARAPETADVKNPASDTDIAYALKALVDAGNHAVADKLRTLRDDPKTREKLTTDTLAKMVRGEAAPESKEAAKAGALDRASAQALAKAGPDALKNLPREQQGAIQDAVLAANPGKTAEQVLGPAGRDERVGKRTFAAIAAIAGRAETSAQSPSAAIKNVLDSLSA